VSGPDRVIRWSTAAAVIGVAVVAAVVSYEHACALVHAHGEAGWTAILLSPAVKGRCEQAPGDFAPMTRHHHCYGHLTHSSVRFVRLIRRRPFPQVGVHRVPSKGA
jgi:hypothetical protein